MTVSVSRSEYCPENYQGSQRESPESEEFSKGPQRTLRAGGQEQDDVSGDGYRGRRKQR
jgi:hypothetical protein